MTKPKEDISICRHDDLKDQGCIVVDIDGTSIGAYYKDGELRAYLNICPHMGGPVCQGKIMPRTLEAVREDGRSAGLNFSKTDMHIVCPWHGYEYDMLTGEHPADAKYKLKSFPIRVENGDIIVTLGQ